MKFLSFKILLLCTLLPPILYMLSMHFGQKLYIGNHLKTRYAKEIENIYIGDTRPLLDGSIRLKDAVKKNITQYLQSNPLFNWGIKANVTVITKQGTILYPEFFEEEKSVLVSPVEVAAENYRLMNEGLVVSVDLKLEHNTLISNGMLSFHIFIFLIILFFYYRSGMKKVMREEIKKNEEIDRLIELEHVHNNVLNLLEQDKEKLAAEISQMKKAVEREKSKSSKNEDQMIEEILSLEEKLKQNIAFQEEQEEEIEALKEKIKRLEKSKPKDGKPSDSVAKRFRTLYKNLSVHDRAIDGFLDLPDDMRIKCEEIIHQLNDDSSLVTIKRKVFGKKNRETVLEVLFAYKGRLYFRRLKDNSIEVLTIGTKNTQLKDLEFLDNL